MASTIASSVLFGCGDVDLTLLQGGSISDGGGGGVGAGNGGDGNLHLLQYSEGGGDDDKNDDLYLSKGSATICLAITASMTGGRVNGGRTIFLSTGPPPRGPPLRVRPLTSPGRSRMARTQCSILECSMAKCVP
nr:hypothetical protein [Tanacetum cinerariifolium]